MTRKRKIITGVVSLALVAAVGVGATLAFMMDHAEKVNQFKIGTVDIDIPEPDFPVDKVVPITPDEIVAKNPHVTNVSTSNDAYVRMQVAIPTIEITNEKGEKETIEMFQFGTVADEYLVKNADGSQTGSIKDTAYTIERVTIPDPDGKEGDTITFEKKVLKPDVFNAGAYNTAQWLKSDSFTTDDNGNHVYTFYYVGPTEGKLAISAATERLFDAVQLDIRVKEANVQQGANVIVTSDAIQTQGYDIPAFGEGTSYICVAQAAFAAVEK